MVKYRARKIKKKESDILMKNFVLLLTCSLFTSFLGLTAQVEQDQKIEAGTQAEKPESNPALESQASAGTAEPKIEEEQTRSTLTPSNTENSTESAEKPAEKPAAAPAAPKKEFRKLSSRELVAQYIASGLFGALTGTGCHFIEKHNLAELNRPWSWMLEYAIRAGVMNTVEEDMEKNRDVTLAPGAVKIAQASSWIAYLTAKCIAA